MDYGMNVKEIIKAYPSLTEEHIKSALKFAAQITEREFRITI